MKHRKTTKKEDRMILAFLHTCPLAVLSTVNKKQSPEAALIAFCETENFEIIFESFCDTRKNANVKETAQVALVTGFSPTKHITFQYEGIATQQYGEEITNCKECFKQKNTPCSDEFLTHPNVRFFKILPTWLRYSDYTVKPPVIIERQFASNRQGTQDT